MSTTQTTEKAEAHTAEQSAKHTPGPWTCTIGRYPKGKAFGFGITANGKIPFVASANLAGPNHGLVIDAADRKYITTGYSEEEVEANARLIAAAPELLEALKVIRDATVNPFVKATADEAISKAEKGAQ